MKKLIINADDFGYSKIFNEKVLELIEKDLVRSTTVMVNWITEDQNEQIKKLINLRESHNLSVGLHLEFKKGDYPSQIKHQFEKFKEVLGFNPSHVDIHKVHSLMESYQYAIEFCKKINIPIRNSGMPLEGVMSTSSEAFFGSIEDFDKIREWIETFEEGKNYEILFHPGEYDPSCKSSLNKNRERDVKHIEQLNSILEENNIQLISYSDLS